MAVMLTILAAIIPVAAAHAATPAPSGVPADVKFGTVKVDGLNIAYREAGDPSSPKLVLLHGFPASSHQYRDLIRVLGDKFHVIAPDYPGFGNSDTPDPAKYAYTFDKLSEVGGEAYLMDLPTAEMHRLVGGHFAVEDNLEYVSDNIHRFYADKVATGAMRTVGMK